MAKNDLYVVKQILYDKVQRTVQLSDGLARDLRNLDGQLW